MSKKICVIPARGGSKRIPRKNIREFCGKPIIAWSIIAANESNCFDNIVVSTDDLEIAEIAKYYGAEAPFIRPKELSDDYTGTTEVVSHAIRWFIDNLFSVELTCCLYATAPFVTSNDIRYGMRQLLENDADFAITVTTFPFPIQRAIKLTNDGRISMFHPENFNTRSQDLEMAYHDAGQFYWGKSSAWLADSALFDINTVPIILPRIRVQDIDTMEDWESAEKLFMLSNRYHSKG